MTAAEIERRKQLLARKLREAGVDGAADGGEPGIPPRSSQEHAPLSFAQQHAWHYQQARPDSVANNLCLVLTVHGEVREDVFRAAFAAVVQRHETLRTTYHARPGYHPYQRVHESLPPRVDVIDGTGSAAEPTEIARDVAAEPFDLSAEGPLRLTLVRGDGQLRAIILLVQHIVWDGRSFVAISHDLREAYEELLRGREPDATAVTPHYADFAEWEQRTWQHRPNGEEDRTYWHRKLTPLPRPLALPYRADAPDEPADEGERADRTLHIGPRRLRAVAKQHATTPFVIFLACYLAVLRNRSRCTDLALGTLLVDRDHPGLDRLVGNFSNPVALRFDLEGRTGDAELIRAVKTECESGFRHGTYPFLPLAAELSGHDGSGRVPLFDTMVVFVAEDLTGPQLPGAQLHWQRADNGAAQFPLVPLGVEAFVRPDAIDVQFTYCTDMFDRSAILGLLDELEAELDRMTAGGQLA